MMPWPRAALTIAALAALVWVTVGDLFLLGW